MTCPICLKAGLPDEAINCPQCNSDLSQFHLLNKIENKFHNWKKTKIFSAIGFSILIVSASVIIIGSNESKKDNLSIATKPTSDSTAFYRKKYFHASQKIDSLQTEKRKPIIVDYRVRQGDNLSVIAYSFYNDANKFKQIAEINNISGPYKIYVNQILKIEIGK